MTQTAFVYAQALYDLAKEEAIAESVLSQLQALAEGFSAEPDFIRLLSTPSLSKQERCQILDDSFGRKTHPYVLNFLKILTEKGYMRYFPDCCSAYERLYNRDNGILVVTAVSAAPLTPDQTNRLTQKLEVMTQKHIRLRSRIDPAVLGGIRLDYDGRQVDDTLLSRLDAIGTLLKNTVL